MRPSLRDIQQLEAYLSGQLPAEEREHLRQRLLLEPELYAQFQQQKQTYRLIRRSGRRRLKRELEKIHCELFSEQAPLSWRERILSLFR
ncbi:hypothetical protein [Flavilitoribacter nigricans]|uniref:Anti-sigma factor n=1 Tax=Flavilitoribacter nigricans (strain ATCC 23147 / DSM 23189 / NBRC 102662 / NCIMB 1420 / SS-2) TaxID=1122177 RepID=A0A2D0N8P2_FLAN2|nr:hypothetical protein [Flavilitoribacter nigricans]PHN04750.1 hypothetical protein CRP01_19740 [Flavilitoribacter nigricans DSM 23189 = NBRC 102662]